MEICKQFRFEAAHRLPRVPEGHKCARLHGHSYRFDVVLRGPIDPELGWVTDFGQVTQVVEPVLRRLDHYYLNEIEGLQNPTSENLAVWLWERLKPHLRHLARIVVSETCTSSATYDGRVL